MDFWESLREQLRGSGFYRPDDSEPNLYCRIENPVFYLVYFLDQSNPVRARMEEIFTAYARDMLERLRDLDCTRLVALSVAVDNSGVDSPVDFVDNVDNAGGAAGAADFYRAEDIFFRIHWDFSPGKGVAAAAGQPDRLLGIERLLAAAAKGEAPEELPLREAADGKPVLVAAFLLSWVALLAWGMLSGRQYEIFSAYGLSRRGVLAGEYYRLATAMFLHDGPMHLLSNGIYLYYFGSRAELLLGKARFLLLYFAAGLCGGLCSILFRDGLSVGASGAIFGLVGAMLLLTRKRGARVTGMSYSTMLLLAVSILGFGLLDPWVDNFGHIGGLLGGAAAFCLMMRGNGKE